jgi:hypothetical protein
MDESWVGRNRAEKERCSKFNAASSDLPKIALESLIAQGP